MVRGSGEEGHSSACIGRELDVRKGINKENGYFLLVEGAVLVIVFFLDLFRKFGKGRFLKILRKTYDILSFVRSGNIKFALLNAKGVLFDIQDDFLNVLLTFGTILAAAVIFFYSVQDNRKEGIPNRTIMSYTSGSMTVPVLFLNMVAIIPVSYVTSGFGLEYFVWTGMLFTYVTQMLILWIILKSTSHTYSVHAICNAEIQQYQKLMEIENRALEKGRREYPFLWTYLLQHLEQVLMSDEIDTDKLETARRLLRVPYYEKEISIWEDPILPLGKFRGRRVKFVNTNPKLSSVRLKENNLKSIYEFYYRNLIPVLRCMGQQKYMEERNKIYLILYDFLEELKELCDGRNTGSAEKDEEFYDFYVMTICGALNVVMDSNVPESEQFCHYVLNNLVSKSAWDFQIFLYIRFQEYLLCTNREAVKLTNPGGIKNLDNWDTGKVLHMVERAEEFWTIWVGVTTFPMEQAQRQFWRRDFEFGNMKDAISLINDVNQRLENI